MARRTIPQRVLSGLVTLVSRVMANRTPSAYDPLCDVCDGDVGAGFHWVHRPGGPLLAVCPYCLPEVRAAGLLVDPILRRGFR